MRARRNLLAQTLLVVATFALCFWMTTEFHTGGLYALGLAGALKLTAEQLADWEERFRDATRDTGLCKSAQYMGLQCGDLSLSLKNEGSRAIDARRIDQLPILAVQRWYWLGSQRFGLPIEARRYLRLALDIVTDEKERRA